MAFVATVMSLAPGAPAQDQSAISEPVRRTVLRFLTTDDFPPFNFKDEDGTLTGFNVDLARAICLDLNTTCSITERDWKGILEPLGNRQADAVIAGHIVTARALGTVDFTERYFHMAGRFVGHQDGAVLDGTPESLDGRSIGIAKATTHEAYVKAFFHSSRIVRFESPELARDALLTKKVDVIFGDGVSLGLWINGTLSRGCCEFKGGPHLEPNFFGDGMAIAVTKNDRRLREDLNTAIRRLRENGRFEELILRYFPHRVF